MATKISELAAVVALANPDELELVDKDDVTHGPAGTSKKCTVQQIRQTADDHIANATGAHAATAISNAPAGGIAATTVQAAIDELDTEKLAATHEGAGGAVHADVVAGGADGFMTGADKSKLDGIPADATNDDTVNAHIGTGGTAHAAVVPAGAAGFMSGADKTKLDGISAGAEPNTVDSVDGRTGVVTLTDLYTAAAHAGSGGTAHADVVAGGADGFMTGADKTKLDGITAGAQPNDPDTVLSSPINQEVQVSQVIGITQTAYDALTPDANTLYLITGP